MTNINNRADLIDSRDLIERIEDLKEEIGAYALDEESGAYIDENGSDVSSEVEELEKLTGFADQFRDYAPDFEYGETAIRDSYFQDYAQELAEDIGAINSDAVWPHTCIDWEQAARELKMDYSGIEFDGVTYWVR